MTTLDEATEAVYQRFSDQWGATTAFSFENENFDEPADQPWARVSVSPETRTQETLGQEGNRKFDEGLRIFVQVYTLADTGVKQGEQLAKQARDIFEGARFGGLRCNSGPIRRSPVRGKWLQHVAEVECNFEEIK